MKDFRKLMASRTGFIPKTQAQALVAVEEGVVREEFFVHRAVNIHPVFEEPWDFDEIERLLAKPDLDMDTTIVLMTIFERLIHDKDKESALFAAESINALEQRFLGRIQSLKKEAAGSRGVDVPRRLVEAYYELGRLFFARPMLRNFYWTEGKHCFEHYRNELVGDERAMAAYARILLKLGQLGEADREIASFLQADANNAGFRMLAAESAFKRRNFQGVVRHLEKANPDGAARGAASGAAKGAASSDASNFAELQRFWTGNACHD